ncbi:MAG: PepSY domain-containing protein [Bdellovibrio sp.]
MKNKTWIMIFTLMLSGQVLAKKNCTDEPKDKWMSEAEFKKMVTEKGYTITKFKQPGTCYEIYGKNSNGQKVEIYFNPVTGAVVKEEIDD